MVLSAPGPPTWRRQGSAKMGLKSVELLSGERSPGDQADRFDLVRVLTPEGNSIPNGLNRTANPRTNSERAPATASASLRRPRGLPNVICMSGNRKGMDDHEGMKNCAEGLKKVVGLAEEKKVIPSLSWKALTASEITKTICTTRPDWGVELCKMVGSPRFQLLYDIYHMQIMEGDVIATINKYKNYIGHYHTGGVPGRHEIDDTQELNYPAICKAILKTGYTGYLSQEFIPAHEPMASLAASVRICDGLKSANRERLLLIGVLEIAERQA